ncbi:MAG: DEAD/DEAH box helicase family protein [Oscillospiraceae bacterium]|nr:DEAD/DEAH box helicase family protein [Oscillospiraceae bacterium]
MRKLIYQDEVIADIDAFLNAVSSTGSITGGWRQYWAAKDIDEAVHYQNKIKNVPHICTKVPTGGGKTYIGCRSLRHIFSQLLPTKEKLVIWLVPSDSILTQTVKALSDPGHPYRRKLDADFAGRVGVYTKEMLLNGQNFSPDTVQELLTICVMSYASLRIDSKKKDVRKVYQENGNLQRFADHFKDKEVLLADTPETALIQVLRYYAPVVIVDESHNAGSTLSTEMLTNLNPSFILELTATPRSTSNIISYVDARKLKKENMIKLPVIVFNRNSVQTVIKDAVQLRGNIEKQAVNAEAAGGDYIRPIVLFQAQPRINEESETFDRTKQILLDMGIPENQIGIKTSNVDTISSLDLMSRDCEIRYIITVNALKEGWDCPFAYILASLANKTSKVDVEQILGRILRQPHAKQHKGSLLNTSYVFSCSNDFHATVDSVVAGLNKSGFSRKDCRVVEPEPEESMPGYKLVIEETNQYELMGVRSGSETEAAQSPEPQTEEDDIFTDVNTDDLRKSYEEQNAAGGETEDGALAEMINTATAQTEQYNREVNRDDSELVGGELGDRMNQNRVQQQYREEMKEFRVPQFVYADEPSFVSYDAEYEVLAKEHLSKGFSLRGQDAHVNFTLSTGVTYRVDVADTGEEAIPKYVKITGADEEFYKKLLETFPNGDHQQHCASAIAHQVNKNDRLNTAEVEEYVKQVISNMTEEELSVMETSIPTYANKIREKIETLEEDFRQKKFSKWLDSGTITCEKVYRLADVITPAKTIDTIPKSLYEAEKDDLNTFERKVIDVVVSLGNVEWWHRIIERKDFFLNGWFYHYPDFMVMTKSGKLVLIEAKGDYLDGDDSRDKLELGRKWQQQSGKDYRYFMVFEKKVLGLDGSYTLDEFVEIMKKL